MKREVSVVVQATQREHLAIVEGPGADGRFVVVVDGVERKVDARRVRAGTWSLIIDSAAYLVDLDPRRTAIAVSVGEASVGVVVEDARHKRLRAAAQRPGTAAKGESLRAPIAGKVVKLAVAIGDTVSVGQAVVVLEAMKMENELVAERGGTVTAIHKVTGQAVDTGDVLVELA
jgi:biotin carboxyl carrier protein